MIDRLHPLFFILHISYEDITISLPTFTKYSLTCFSRPCSLKCLLLTRNWTVKLEPPSLFVSLNCACCNVYILTLLHHHLLTPLHHASIFTCMCEAPASTQTGNMKTTSTDTITPGSDRQRAVYWWRQGQELILGYVLIWWTTPWRERMEPCRFHGCKIRCLDRSLGTRPVSPAHVYFALQIRSGSPPVQNIFCVQNRRPITTFI